MEITIKFNSTYEASDFIERLNHVKNGKWIIQEDLGKTKLTLYTCSECKATTAYPDGNYCYNCGAKMEKFQKI